MSKYIVLYNYNKYYNRIIKRLNTFADYQALITPVGSTPAQYRGFLREDKNFNFADGIYTKHVINIGKNDPQFAKMDQPDYFILEETYTEGTGEDAIVTKKVSRWFVLEADRLRGNQYELSLRRDLLADYYDNVINAPVFVEKGWINSIEDPAIFNKESLTFNQIKKSELLLNDNKFSGNKKGWIVGYLARAKEAADNTISASGQEEPPQAGYTNFEDLPAKIQAMITAGEAYYFNEDKFSLGVVVRENYSNPTSQYKVISQIIVDSYEDNSKWATSVAPLSWNDYAPYLDIIFRSHSDTTADFMLDQYREYFNPTFKAFIDDYIESELTSTDFSTANYLSSYQGIIYKKNNKYYRLSIRYADIYNYYEPFIENAGRFIHFKYTISQLLNISDSLAGQAKAFLNRIIDGVNAVYANGDVSKYAFDVGRVGEKYILESTEITMSSADVTIPSTRNALYDAPFDMFCIPLGNVTVRQNGSDILETAGNVALPIARAISLVGTTAKVYDIQLLPYCPFDEILDSQGRIDITGFTADEDYTFITHGSGGSQYNLSIVLFPKSCKGTFDINVSSSDPNYSRCLAEYSDSKTKKIRAETEFARFVSPNFASMFDINVQKNNGIVSLNVDYFYKPYSPYIHVAPYFSGLYGNDFNDPKGLICSGDFSISTASDQWQSYQIQNKNYELMFNRQIMNLDVNNSIAYEQQKISSALQGVTSAFTGAAAGAVSGSYAAGGVGAVVGGTVGAVASAATSFYGRSKDLEFLRKSQSEARSYAVDMYTYNLGNIQALPNTLTKVSTFTQNNKVFPFIEFYDCTDVEKEALENKIKYNGMTIMRIGKIADFIGNEKYVQGQLIRLTGIDEDSHVIAEIANEIKEGAYFYGYDSE